MLHSALSAVCVLSAALIIRRYRGSSPQADIQRSGRHDMQQHHRFRTHGHFLRHKDSGSPLSLLHPRPVHASQGPAQMRTARPSEALRRTSPTVLVLLHRLQATLAPLRSLLLIELRRAIPHRPSQPLPFSRPCQRHHAVVRVSSTKRIGPSVPLLRTSSRRVVRAVFDAFAGNCFGSASLAVLRSTGSSSPAATALRECFSQNCLTCVPTKMRPFQGFSFRDSCSVRGERCMRDRVGVPACLSTGNPEFASLASR